MLIFQQIIHSQQETSTINLIYITVKPFSTHGWFFSILSIYSLVWVWVFLSPLANGRSTPWLLKHTHEFYRISISMKYFLLNTLKPPVPTCGCRGGQHRCWRGSRHPASGRWSRHRRLQGTGSQVSEGIPGFPPRGDPGRGQLLVGPQRWALKWRL